MLELVRSILAHGGTLLLGLLGTYTSMRLVRSILARGGQPIGP
jgi:hypothetical protein